MGSLHASEMANSGMDPDIALQWHLQSNHYPPVHVAFVPVAKYCIEQGVEAQLYEDWDLLDEIVTLPNGRELSVGEVIEGLHLNFFIDARLADDEDEDGS